MSNLTTTGGGNPAALNIFDPQQFEMLQRMAKMLAQSELVPEMYRVTAKNPEAKAMANIIIALSLAQRMNADQLMVMQNLIVIQGRPTWSAKFLVATVNTSGRFEPLQYEIKVVGKLGKVPYTEYVWDGSRKVAQNKVFDGTAIDNIECYAYSADLKSKKVLKGATVSVKVAVQEGWYQKAGSKWPNMTEQMLMYRAASFWTNAYAPDISMGMKTDDEARDTIDTDYIDVTDRAGDAVAATITQNANTKTMTFDDEPKAGAADPDPIAKSDPDAQAGSGTSPSAPTGNAVVNEPETQQTPVIKAEQQAETNVGGLFPNQDNKAKGPGFN